VLAIFNLSRVTFRAGSETNHLSGQQPAFQSPSHLGER
jgi:hypothetical protein